MISINANTITKIAEFLTEYPFYLFVFTDTECKKHSYIFEATEQDNCGNYRLFDLLVDVPIGTYDLAIYGQESETNTDTDLAELLHEEKAKIYNPENICFDMPYLLDENGYPLLDENEINILQ